MSHEIPQNSEIHTCIHQECGEPRRLEYCEVEATDIDGDASVNIEMIDHLLYKRADFETCVEYAHDGQTRYISREFTYLLGDSNSWVWPLTEMRVRLLHEQDIEPKRDTYEVRIGWRVLQKGASESFYETIYTLEPWQKVTHSTIEEFYLSTEQLTTHAEPSRETRPMTGYDHGFLFDRLSELDNMRVGEEREHAAITNRIK